MGYGPLSQRPDCSELSPYIIRCKDVSAISLPFGRLWQSGKQVIHILLTLSPVYCPPCGGFLPRLACVRHAASVCSEPGSNPPKKVCPLIRLKPHTKSIFYCQRTEDNKVSRNFNYLQYYKITKFKNNVKKNVKNKFRKKFRR